MFWTPTCRKCQYNTIGKYFLQFECAPGEFLLSKDVDVMLWQDWKKYSGKSKLRDLGNFVVVDNRLMEEFDEFKPNMIEPGVILLPSCDLLQYWITKEKKRPFNTVMRFGSPYVPMSIDQIDDLLDWVTQAKERLKQGEHVFI